MVIQTQYAPGVRNKEKMSDKSEVETSGYRPLKGRIEEMIEFGTRLQAARNEQYDFKHGEKPNVDFYDPTRDPNFDMADASMLLDGLKTKKEQADEYQSKNKLRSSKSTTGNIGSGQDPISKSSTGSGEKSGANRKGSGKSHEEGDEKNTGNG